MNAWRLAATHTHLYPGARLRCLDESMRERMRAGDPVQVEFTDQGHANGEVLEVLPQGWQLRLDAYSTANGTAIEPKQWLVQWAPHIEPAGTMKIKARVRRCNCANRAALSACVEAMAPA